jgi:hypothetical protein
MRTLSEVQIIGPLGTVKEGGPTLRLTIAAEYGRKDESGELRTSPYRNEVTLFGEGVRAWARAHVGPGDLVHARGTLRQTDYVRDRVTVYGVTLAADRFDLLRKRQAEEGVEPWGATWPGRLGPPRSPPPLSGHGDPALPGPGCCSLSRRPQESATQMHSV